MPVDISEDIVKRMQSVWSKLLNFIKSIQDYDVQSALLNKYRAEEQYEIERKLALLKKLTNNGEKLPEVLTYSEMDKSCFDYIIQQANKYNLSDEGEKKPLIYEAVVADNGSCYILCTEDTKTKLLDYQMEFAIEKGGYVSIIPIENFAKVAAGIQTNDGAKYYGEGNNVTIVKNVTEDQLIYLKNNTWGNKNQFSFSYTPNEDGTYNVVILSRNFLGNMQRETKDDLFGALVAEKVVNTENNKKAAEYNEKIAEKIFNFNGTREDGKPADALYITSANNACGYLKVTKDKVIFCGQEGEINSIPRPGSPNFAKTPENEENFKKEIYKYINCRFVFTNPKHPDLVALYDTEFANKLPNQSKQFDNIDNFMQAHARTGDDSHFQTMINGKPQYIRPMYDNINETDMIENVIRNYTQEIGIKANKGATHKFADNIGNRLNDIINNIAISETDKNSIITDVKNKILEEGPKRNIFSLSEFKQIDFAKEVVTEVVEASKLSNSKINYIRDTFNYNTTEIKTLTEADQKQAIQTANVQLATDLKTVIQPLSQSEKDIMIVQEKVIESFEKNLKEQGIQEKDISSLTKKFKKGLCNSTNIQKNFNGFFNMPEDLKTVLDKNIENMNKIIENGNNEFSDDSGDMKSTIKKKIMAAKEMTIKDMEKSGINETYKITAVNLSQAVSIKDKMGYTKIISGAELPITQFPAEKIEKIVSDIQDAVSITSNQQYKIVYIDDEQSLYNEVNYDIHKDTSFNKEMNNKAAIEANYVSDENKKNENTYIKKERTRDFEQDKEH